MIRIITSVIFGLLGLAALAFAVFGNAVWGAQWHASDRWLPLFIAVFCSFIGFSLFCASYYFANKSD